MSDPNDSPPQDQPPLNPVTEFKSLLHVASNHFRDLGELAKIEAGELGQFVGKKLVLAIAAAVFGLFLYLLIIIGLIGWLPTLIGWPWFYVAFALAGVHLLVLLILVIALKSKPDGAFFEGTKAQIEKDKKCFAPNNPAARNN